MRILCIHGIGGKDRTIATWSPKWEKTINESAGLTNSTEYDFLLIDDLFKESKDRMGIRYAEGLAKFIKSWIQTTIGKEKKQKGILDEINWYAGMPMQFITDEILRNQLAKRLKEKIESFKPDIIYAHSLGTLLCYDFFRTETFHLV